ncbi:MAG TPA: hypothetical protein VFQ61_04030 [Polyangiaceae bacterium]|nr:hypothetical protein [Polyangiaceae bacterium]
MPANRSEENFPFSTRPARAPSHTIQACVIVWLALLGACGSEPESVGAASGGQSGHGGDRQPSSGGRTPSLVLCAAQAPSSCPEPAPSYRADIEPIFQRSCVVCHSGTKGGPWALTDYGHVATWRDTVRTALLECSMPPPDSEVSIEAQESQLVLTWIRCGMPP